MEKTATKIVLLIIMGLFTKDGYSQLFEMLNSDIYNSRIKLLSEFMQRFNGEEDNPFIDSINGEKYKLNLCQLFDSEIILKNREINEPKAFQFIDSVLTNSIKIHFNDAEWYAKVNCVGKIKEKEVNFSLYLTVEERGKDMYKWVISDVEGEIFNLTSSKISEKIMLYPNEHESDFMRLNSITHGKDDYITLYSSKQSHVDRLTVFNTLVFYDILNIEYVNDIEYTFLQVPGFIFTVREIDRDSTNSGWLITEWDEVPDAVKNGILQRIYNGEYGKIRESQVSSIPSKDGKLMTEEEGIDMVKSFVSSINRYITDGSSVEKVKDFVKGRFSFIISDKLSDNLAKMYNDQSEAPFRLNKFLEWLGGPLQPVSSIELTNFSPLHKEEIRQEYAQRFTLIACDLSTSGKIELTERVVFFIYEDQIAGLKMFSECIE